MSLFHAVLLGAVQGLTEFLPISSDGHLVMFASLFPVALQGKDALGFDVLLHGASLLALLVLYAKTWLRLLRSPFPLFLLILSALPGAVAGVLLEDAIAVRLRTLTSAGLGFLCTALVLILGERLSGRQALRTSDAPLGVWRILLLGTVQAFAILPGVSRSGLTISAARIVGFQRQSAADLSFLMAVPIIAGAVGKILFDAAGGRIAFPPWDSAIAGFVTTFVVSLLAIVALRRFVRSYSLSWFGWYLIPLGFFLLYHFSELQRWVEWDTLVQLVQSNGAIVVFVSSFIEVIPPISFISPGIFILMIAGSLTTSPLSALLVVLAAVSGVALGNMLLYRLGFFYGRKLAQFLHLSDDRLRRIEAFMARFGRINVFLGQFVGIVRPGVAFVAGTARMSPHQYYLWMVGSCLVWAMFYISLGFFLGAHAPWAVPALGIAGLALYVAGIIAVILEMILARKGAR